MRRARGVMALALTLVGASAGPAPTWPEGIAPPESDIESKTDEAIALAERERAEQFLESYETGEDTEHITVWQDRVARGEVGKEALFLAGEALFHHRFRAAEGLGDGRPVGIRRIHEQSRGGLDTFSCAGCHSVGGEDGAGTETQNAFVHGNGDDLRSANARNAPAMLGLGFVQALGHEMTLALLRLRDQAQSRAKAEGAPVIVNLEAKGVSFGQLTVNTDGSSDASRVVGLDPDLVVKPFGWKGDVASLRRFVEEAARVHFGVQAHPLALGHQVRPDPARLGPGPWFDPDQDGKSRELEEGTLTAGAVYLEMVESPTSVWPRNARLRARAEAGSAVFDRIGCGECHRRTLPLDDTNWHERGDTEGGDVTVDLAHDGDFPKADRLVALYSDLKRHSMGAELADLHASSNGIGADVFLTRPLWGLAESAPYLHDGRAGTVLEAVAMHGGEAERSRQAFAALDAEAQKDLHLFLLTLSRAPRLREDR